MIGIYYSTAPPVLSGPKEVTTMIASQIQLNITLVLAHPSPSTFLWSFNDTLLSQTSRTSSVNNTTLIITDVRRADAGRYTLRAVSEVGKGNWTTELIVYCELQFP